MGRRAHRRVSADQITDRFAKANPIMSIRADEQQGRDRDCTKALTLLALSMLVFPADHALASPDDEAAAVRVQGTYECNSGSTAIVVVNRPVDVEQHTPSNPLLRIAVGPTSKLDLLWWDKEKHDWKFDPSASLTIKHIDATEKYWTVIFEGTFGDRIAAAVSGSLSWFADQKALGLPEKPTLALTQWSPLPFASASALVCDKL